MFRFNEENIFLIKGKVNLSRSLARIEVSRLLEDDKLNN